MKKIFFVLTVMLFTFGCYTFDPEYLHCKELSNRSYAYTCAGTVSGCGEYNLQYDCLTELAKNRSDIYVCEQIPSSGYKEQCIINIK